MSLRKTENQVKDLLTETIVALCRNTLNRYGEVCVEGLLGVTLDKQEIFLVSINQQIENRKLGEQGIVHGSETSGDLSRKRANESDDDGTSDSYSEVSESDGSRVKRKRRRKRKHSRNSQGNSSGEESCQSGDDRETFPTFDLSELKKTGFLSQDSQFSVHSDGLNDFNDGVLSLENNQSHDLEAHQRLDTPIKSEVEDIDHQTSVIKEEREDEECWPSGDNLNEHSTTSGFQTQDKSLSNSHGANPGLGSDESEDADHSVSEQGGPGPSTLNSGAEDVYVPRLFYDDVAKNLPISRESSDTGGNTTEGKSVMPNLTMNAAGFLNPLAQVGPLPPPLDPTLFARSMIEGFNPLVWRGGHLCPFCHKTFAAPNQVRRHLVVHTGEKNYECEICGARFGQKATAKTHRKRIHGLDD